MEILYHHRTRATDAQRVHILELVNALRGLGHRVEIVSVVETEGERKDAAHEAGEAGWKRFVRRIPCAYELIQIGYNLVGLPMLLKRLHAGHFDFIYERYALFNFAGVVAGRLARKPVILEVNSPLALELKRDNDIRGAAFANWTERVICNAASRVIVVSGPLRRMLVANGVRDEKLVVMTNGVNLEHLRPAGGSEELRERLGLRSKVVIGFAGWFRKWHGLEFLIETFHQAKLSGQGAALLLIGDGPAMPELRNYVAANGLGESVVFAGAVPHELISPYLDLMDIAVQPAANEYCCPMKIIEYMGLAKPVVAPRQENIQELLAEGSEALLFTPGDKAEMSQALASLVNDKDARARMGQRALAAVHERGYLWSRNAQRVVDLAALERG